LLNVIFIFNNNNFLFDILVVVVAVRNFRENANQLIILKRLFQIILIFIKKHLRREAKTFECYAMSEEVKEKIL